jgi:hypothetical protein
MVVRHWESKKEEDQEADDGEERQNLVDSSEVSLTFGDADYQMADHQVISDAEDEGGAESEEEDTD